ncbi:MAG: hypothetical protein K2K44_12125 [Oscillospiraceae bacterium]|nr:hypothetical protein [Oscillospiraceae bacterium]
MKSKIIFSLILSALILTACKSEPSIIDELEASGTTASAQAVQVVQGGTNSAENEGEANYILGGETETTVSVTETTAETEPAEKEFSFDFQKIDISGVADEDQQLASGGIFFSGDIAAVKCYGNESDEIRFFDINDLTVKASVKAPEGWELDNDFSSPCIEGSGDILCKIKLSRFDSEKLNDEYAALIVYNDFTTYLTEGEPQITHSFAAGSHNISDMMYDIFDADRGIIIVEGFEDTATDLGFDSIWYDYNFSIDYNRFVYRICGNERMPGFGYYDFNTDAAVEFPESGNFLPVGYYGEKVFAEQGTWDSMCQGELYTFDMETLEAEHFISSPAELGANDYTEYFMPQSGEYIIASHFDYDNDNYDNSKCVIYIISPDSGEVLGQQEFGSEYNDLRFFAFADDHRFGAFNYNTTEVVIFNVTM